MFYYVIKISRSCLTHHLLYNLLVMTWSLKGMLCHEQMFKSELSSGQDETMPIQPIWCCYIWFKLIYYSMGEGYILWLHVCLQNTRVAKNRVLTRFIDFLHLTLLFYLLYFVKMFRYFDGRHDVVCKFYKYYSVIIKPFIYWNCWLIVIRDHFYN